MVDVFDDKLFMNRFVNIAVTFFASAVTNSEMRGNHTQYKYQKADTGAVDTFVEDFTRKFPTESNDGNLGLLKACSPFKHDNGSGQPPGDPHPHRSTPSQPK